METYWDAMVLVWRHSNIGAGLMRDLPSLFMFIARHFRKRQAWHWFLRATSTTQLPPSLHTYCRLRRMLRLKNPRQPSQLWRKQISVPVMVWKRFAHDWPFVRGIHRSPADSHRNCQWCRALIFPLLLVWIKSWTNSRQYMGNLRHHDALVLSL